eukprot:2336978-Amphidinium_carterae.1
MSGKSVASAAVEAPLPAVRRHTQVLPPANGIPTRRACLQISNDATLHHTMRYRKPMCNTNHFSSIAQ